jgi:PD-(D/E)XK endonuclease
MAHPKAIGDRSTLATMLALHDAGYAVFLPFGENTRYDLIIDDGVSLLRVQCKTGRLRDGAVRFSTCSSYGHHSRPRTHRRDYLGEIDCFAVYCPQTGSAYLVPIEDLSTKVEGALRIEPARNGQQRGVRLGESYEIARVTVTDVRKAVLAASNAARRHEASF